MIWIKRVIRIIAWSGVGLITAGLLFLGISWAVEYRPAERENTLFSHVAPTRLPDTLTLISWNIGYAGLGDNMDFFYDGGTRMRDTRTRTLQNLRSILETLQAIDADIMLLQEVDLCSHRTYGICEVDSLRAAFPDHTLSFAYNYKAWWVPIPLSNPMGRVESGLVTLSRVAPVESERMQYPSAFPFPVRLFNLKRCLLSSAFLTASGDTVRINNTHNTAYDTGGMRTQEMQFLAEWLRKYQQRGQMSVTGGDWNQYPPSYTPKPEELTNPYFVPQAIDTTLMESGFRFVADTSEPSLRYLDRPYATATASQRLTTLTDFFLVSPGVQVCSVEVLPFRFPNSDHDPVMLKIILP